MRGCIAAVVVAGALAGGVARAEDPALPKVDLEPGAFLSRFEGWSVSLGSGSTFGSAHAGFAARIGQTYLDNGVRIEAGPSEGAGAPWPVSTEVAIAPAALWTRAFDTVARSSTITVGGSVNADLSAQDDDDPTIDATSDGGSMGLDLAWSVSTDQRFFVRKGRAYVGTRGWATSSTAWTTTWPDDTDDEAVQQRLFLSAGVGAGAGRLFDVASATRWTKLVGLLRARGTLAADPADDVGDRVLQAWFGLRNEISDLPRVAWTERILADAGLLAHPFDVEDTYVVLAVIRDLTSASRPVGWEVGAWVDTRVDWDDLVVTTDPAVGLVPGVEGTWARLFGPDELVTVRGGVQTRVPLRSVQGWANTSVGVAWTRWFFGRWQDPVGGLSASLDLDVATAIGDGPSAYDLTLRVVPGRVAYRLHTAVGWKQVVSRQARFGLSASVALTQDGYETAPAVLVMLQPSITWGVATGQMTRTALGRAAVAGP